MTEEPILVLGATGKTGRRVVSRLTRGGVVVRAASRTSGTTRFDWSDRETWEPALAGARAAYLIDSQGPDAASSLSEFAKLAVDTDVRRLVLLSARDFGILGDEDLLAPERAVQDSGAEWTILRPSWFAQNFSEDTFVWDHQRGDEVTVPCGQGLEPFIDAGDIADVAVAALTGAGHAGNTYELSGPRLLSFGEAIGEIAAVSGRDLRFNAVSPEQFAEHAAAHGLPEGVIGLLNRLYGSIVEGNNAYLSTGVRDVLGREPRDFADYVQETAATGVWNS